MQQSDANKSAGVNFGQVSVIQWPATRWGYAYMRAAAAGGCMRGRRVSRER